MDSVFFWHSSRRNRWGRFTQQRQKAVSRVFHSLYYTSCINSIPKFDTQITFGRIRSTREGRISWDPNAGGMERWNDARSIHTKDTMKSVNIKYSFIFYTRIRRREQICWESSWSLLWFLRFSPAPLARFRVINSARYRL